MFANNLTSSFRKLASHPQVIRDYHEAFRKEPKRMTSCNAFRYARPLPENAEEQFDATVVRVGRERLRVMAEVLNRGLTYSLPNWLFTLFLTGDKLNEFGVAEEMFDLRSPGEYQLPDRSAWTIPIFAQVSHFEWNSRLLGAAAQASAPLPLESVEQGTRRINELMENQAIFGSTLTINGNSAAGLNNASNLNTYNFESNLAWDDATKTPTNILKDVLTGIQTLRDANFYGPYTLFINDTYENTLQNPFSTSYPSGTIQSNIEDLYPGEGGIRVVSSGRIAANTIFIVQMTSDVVRVIDGDQPTVVNWSPDPGWVTNLAIVACQILQTRDDYDGNCGIVKGTPS